MRACVSPVRREDSGQRAIRFVVNRNGKRATACAPTLLRLAVAVPRHLPHRDDPHTQDASRRSLPVSHYLQIGRAFSTKWRHFHYLQIGKSFPICHIGKAFSLSADRQGQGTRRCDLSLSLPSPSSTSQPGMRPRPFPSRLAMPCARSLPFLAAAPASPRALQSCCSCNLGCQLLGDAPWRRSHLHNWHPECRPAPAWALRTARRSLARVFAACPSAREHTMHSHAKVAQPVGRPWYSLGIV